MWILVALTAFATPWQQPDQEILDVLHAPSTPWTSVSPDAAHILLADTVRYPPLADRAAAMLPLAGIRVDGRTNAIHGNSGRTALRLLDVASGLETSLDIGGARLLDANWSADGDRLAITLLAEDHVGLWVGTVDGSGAIVPDLALIPLLGSSVTWMTDQDRLLVKAVPDRGTPPNVPRSRTARQ